MLPLFSRQKSQANRCPYTLLHHPICGHNEGGHNFILLFSGRCLFTFWCESMDSLKLPAFSSGPGRCSGVLRGRILCTTRVPMQDQAPQALGSPGWLSPLTKTHPGTPWDTSPGHILVSRGSQGFLVYQDAPLASLGIHTKLIFFIW